MRAITLCIPVVGQELLVDGSPEILGIFTGGFGVCVFRAKGMCASEQNPLLSGIVLNRFRLWKLSSSLLLQGVFLQQKSRLKIRYVCPFQKSQIK